MSRGFVILDFETTGLAPKRGDRVVEVGAVYMSPSLQLNDGLETIVNPQRDVGPTSVHGLSARDVFDAPTFDQVAPSLLKMLEGRVIVGHNVSFDLRFLAAELEREGFDVPEFVAIDTVQAAKGLLKSNPPRSYKLGDVAAHLGINAAEVFKFVGLEERPEHSAFGDAMVTSFVLSALIQMAPDSAYWRTHLDQAETVVWPEYVPCDVNGKQRGQTPEQPAPAPISADSASMKDVLHALGTQAPTQPETEEYARLLESALADRVLDATEVDALVETARSLGLDGVTLGSLHRGHFEDVVRAAWADGVLTADEKADIEQLAGLLGIDGDSVKAALHGSKTSNAGLASSLTGPQLAEALPASAIVVLTGEMTVDRVTIETEIISSGFLVANNVTKKTALVIAADPYTQSGKAKKAHAYGISILGEAEGLALIRRSAAQ
ncbi:exonuclease domain-containing protein [Leucobacter sp. gxy201]|uniref:exonuclease domain-containing protein n=1 Tax=Leucobacter sp. gxy201 TaxID=2957200 RepID=UPI003DA17BF7